MWNQNRRNSHKNGKQPVQKVERGWNTSPHAVEDLTAGNKKGVIVITYAAMWAELSLQFCTNCSESIKLYNPKEMFSVTFRASWPWEPLTYERRDTFICVLCFPEEHIRNHWLERERVRQAGRQKEIKGEDTFWVISFEAACFCYMPQGVTS